MNFKNLNRLCVLLVIVATTSSFYVITNKNKTIAKISNSKLTIDFPKNPEINASEYGEVQFTSDLDTIELNEKRERIRVLYVGKFKETPTIEELKKMPLDSFVLKNKKTPIPFHITFDEEGEYELGGYLKETIITKNFYDNVGDQTRTVEIRIRKKVTPVKKHTMTSEEVDKQRVFLRFPKTHKLNTDEYGEIFYKVYLDTLKLKENETRSTVFHYGVFKKANSIEDLKGNTTYSCKIIKDKNSIPFKVNFNEEGEFVFDGYIEDVISQNKDSITSSISKQIKISKQIIVTKE